MAVASKVHPFERAGFGHAPYRYVGHSRAVFQAVPGDPSCPLQPGAACDYCGTGIMDVFHVRSADGVEFKVGCDCIRRVHAEFDAEIPVDFRQQVARMEAEKRAAKRSAKFERDMARVRTSRAALDADPALFATDPHPHAHHAANGKTKRDYFLWVLSWGGQTGKLEVCRAIEAATTPELCALSRPDAG